MPYRLKCAVPLSLLQRSAEFVLIHSDCVDRYDGICRIAEALLDGVAVDVEEGMDGSRVHEAPESKIGDLEALLKELIVDGIVVVLLG